MDFRLLGALEVTVDGQRLDLGGVRQHTVLAVLLLEANRPVAVHRLMEAIYGDDPPATSRAQVQICISSLRRLFGGYGHEQMIVTRAQGYAFRADSERIDAHRFENLVLKARQARDNRGLEEAVRYYREALALWRGPALEGIESRVVQSAASWLDEERLTANEDCVQLELDLGRHHEVVSELRRLVEEHPLRERLLGQFMTALYRSGRQAEALQVYRDARRTMIDELGIEPNERLQQLEHAILTADESLNPPRESVRVAAEPPPPPAAPPAVPGMLPAGIADFIGRNRQLEEIRQRLTKVPDGAARFAVPIVAISGRAGIGKTTIAVHAAHSVADVYPDGQLFADLHGGISRPVSPMQVLERFLRALGVPGSSLPEGLEERAETYRSLLADRRMLIVLDDVSNESQVLPLLPGNPASAVIVSSRSRLVGLAGAMHVDVDLFDVNQSVDLLAQVAGAERVEAEREAAEALAELCGHLPLALRIAGARLAARPHWSVEQLVERLRDETRRLDELMHGEMGIRASLSLTYEGISEEARRLLRRLAVLDSRIFSVWTGAALLDRPLTEAQDLLDDLADAHLVEVLVGRGPHTQYQIHDLIRVFARERLAAEEPPAERKAALSRVLGSLLALTCAARSREFGADVLASDEGTFPGTLPERVIEQLVADPMPWFERERYLLVSGIRQAAQAGFVELCWRLAANAAAFFESRVYLDDWRETHEIALDAARQAGDRRGEAEMLYTIGSLSFSEQRFDEARQELEAAVRLFEEVGDDHRIALAIRSIAVLERINGRFAEAVANYEKALKVFHSAGDHVSAAHTLYSLAQLRLDCDDLDGAKTLLAEALTRSKAGGDRRVTAQVLHRMGQAHLQAGEYGLSAGSFEEALTVVRGIGDSIGEALALHGFAIARLRQGKIVEAEETLQDALKLATASRHRLAEARVLSGLGELASALGEPGQAATHLRRAAGLFRGMQMPLYEAQTLIMLGDALYATGDYSEADDVMARTLDLADRIDEQAGQRVREQLFRVQHARPPARGGLPAAGAWGR
ncbi:AfsR/SARP family transcriptional regulator [Microbispora siamensis]|uniref:AfsR/SARP family transcriptional regulator n=1 Tax=Microbispora siamensis TaxID=564413 RepID=UPI0019506425|nr:BTAD domain-containing putative transcriptional regulator [Microbispora siamensis]